MRHLQVLFECWLPFPRVYHFLQQKDFGTINKFFNYVGTISIKKDYRNATGGTIASSFDDFRTQLNMWDKMFGENGRIMTLAEIFP